MAILLSDNTKTGEGGRSCCRPYEEILSSKAGVLADKDKVISIGIGGFNQDLFVVK